MATNLSHSNITPTLLSLGVRTFKHLKEQPPFVRLIRNIARQSTGSCTLCVPLDTQRLMPHVCQWARHGHTADTQRDGGAPRQKAKDKQSNGNRRPRECWWNVNH
ncbi:unnamed protein product [Arctogadus glacialis]